MSLNISTNKNINDKLITNNFIKKFSYEGDKIYSNSKFGTSNKVDLYDLVKSKYLLNILGNNIGVGNCDKSEVNIKNKNNDWFDCCNIEEKGICFDGENLRDLTAKNSIIEEYKRAGWKFVGMEGCTLKFEKGQQTLPNDTDIYAFFDTTSMNISDAIVARQALIDWHASIVDEFPTYVGNLYVICFVASQEDPNAAYADAGALAERWLREAKYVYEGSQAVASISGWASLNILPPNFTNPSLYVPPANVIVLSFIDEAYNQVITPGPLCATSSSCGYHGENFPSFGTGASTNPTQPTIGYNTDFSAFLAARSNFTTYKQVLYPINKSPSPTSSNQYNANVLQMVAAVKGRLLTPAEVASFPSSADLNLLTTTNPYTTPLENYGITGVFDKTSPASEVFTADTFGDELNSILDIKVSQLLTTTAELPIKKLSENVKDVNNIWSLYKLDNEGCVKLNDETKVKLYKQSLK